MTSADVAGVLELVAGERPDLLRPVVDALEFSRAAASVAELVERWGIGPEDRAAELAELAAKTSAGLDQLERSGYGWSHPREVIEAPSVFALLAFAYARRARVQGLRRRRRLEVMARKLERAAESDRRRRSVERFLGEPARPVDSRWLREFLGERRGEGKR